jgi:hypothetical protein
LILIDADELDTVITATPTETPFTSPNGDTLAMAVLELDHVIPGGGVGGVVGEAEADGAVDGDDTEGVGVCLEPPNTGNLLITI